MKYLLASLAVLLWAVPITAHAADPPAHHQLPPGCARAIHSHARHDEDTPRCLAGTVLSVGLTTVKIQIPHGPQMKFTLTPKTVLETDSAIASLEGLMVGDFACASGMFHDQRTPGRDRPVRYQPVSLWIPMAQPPRATALPWSRISDPFLVSCRRNTCTGCQTGVTYYRETDALERIGCAMYFKQILDERCGCASYLIASRQSHEAAVVDPSIDLEQYDALLQERDFTLKYVIDTHVHADHVSGARKLAEQHGAALCLHESAGVSYQFPTPQGRGGSRVGPTPGCISCTRRGTARS